MEKSEKVAILYSGGTDSTCAASILTEKFREIHLITFKRLGFSCLENSNYNVNNLKEKFPNTIFIHRIISIDVLSKYINNTEIMYLKQKMEGNRDVLKMSSPSKITYFKKK